MENNLKDMLLGDYLADLASKAPTPGGGAVAAITGAQAASLIVMVCELTKTDAKAPILGRAESARNRFIELGTADMQAFTELMAIYRMPDEPARKAQLQNALRKAAEPPRAMLLLIDSLIDDLVRLFEIGNRNLISDTAIAAVLADATVKSAVLNMRINLKQIRDRDYRSTLEQEIVRVEAHATTLNELNDAVCTSLRSTGP